MRIFKNIYKVLCCAVLVGIIVSFGDNNKVKTFNTKNDNLTKNINLSLMNSVVKSFSDEEVAEQKRLEEEKIKAEEEKKKLEEQKRIEEAKKQAAVPTQNVSANAVKSYSGRLTAYVATCPGCSGRLGCNGQNVTDGTTTYNDKTFGVVNIVASSSNLPCGSIVRFNSNYSSSGVVTAVVLDRGVSGTTLDILVDSVNTARTKVGSSNINYDVLRIGW